MGIEQYCCTDFTRWKVYHQGIVRTRFDEWDEKDSYVIETLVPKRGGFQDPYLVLDNEDNVKARIIGSLKAKPMRLKHCPFCGEELEV